LIDSAWGAVTPAEPGLPRREPKQSVG